VAYANAMVEEAAYAASIQGRVQGARASARITEHSPAKPSRRDGRHPACSDQKLVTNMLDQDRRGIRALERNTSGCVRWVGREPDCDFNAAAASI
jgi:hypothetical protein